MPSSQLWDLGGGVCLLDMEVVEVVVVRLCNGIQGLTLLELWGARSPAEVLHPWFECGYMFSLSKVPKTESGKSMTNKEFQFQVSVHDKEVGAKTPAFSPPQIY